MLKPSLIAKTDAKADKSQIEVVGDVRITYLTSCLIRVESSKFTDLASRTVWFRRFEAGKMNVTEQKGKIFVETEDVIFEIRSGKPYKATFKCSGLSQTFLHTHNFKGTCRTLDMASGARRLDDGILTKEGVYLLDDSRNFLLDDTGHFISREGGRDYYAFAYGKDYRETLRAFYKISSPVPLIPRYALGVWWSRYHAYTQQEYLDLMKRFKAEDIPITVATVDMDWHWVRDIDKKFGVKYNGWTGYSWNTELFPDYREFLKKLKDDNLHVTLNLHPADGVHCFEDMYEEMAKANGIDPASKQTVKFKCGSDDFWNSYFDILHKPYEKDGVDFWWIDWQQGKKSDVPGLDPLTVLNHYHTLDNAEDGRMPMILSRYAGLGSHRYPLGFSGDTFINWKTLDFQPYFTVNAANAAYSWWSHDIGGHHFGYRDDDLYLRWIQFGTFSPILRLHSTATEILGKEPWKYRSEVYKCAKEWLRFRHKLIPYIFTMDYRTHNESFALCEPMYYQYPGKGDAYKVKNQYMFGSELIVCPITRPQHKEICMGSVKCYIPEGRWVDIFTNQVYNGEKMIDLYRDIDTIPVLAREGAIIPLSADEGNKTENPQNFEIWAFSGNGSFTVIEDNSKTDFANHNVKTKLEIKYSGDEVTFTVNKAEGDTSVIPKIRNYHVVIKDLIADGKQAVIDFDGCDINETYTKTLTNVSRAQKEPAFDAVVRMMSRWQGSTDKRNRKYKYFKGLTDEHSIAAALKKAHLPNAVAGVINEFLNQE